MSETMKVNRRGFIALSAAALAAGLFGWASQSMRMQTGEVSTSVWLYHGALLRVNRTPGKTVMSFRADGKTYALGCVHNPNNCRRREEALGASIRHTIDQKSGYNERWLAERKAQFARMSA